MGAKNSAALKCLSAQARGLFCFWTLFVVLTLLLAVMAVGCPINIICPTPPSEGEGEGPPAEGEVEAEQEPAPDTTGPTVQVFAREDSGDEIDLQGARLSVTNPRLRIAYSDPSGVNTTTLQVTLNSATRVDEDLTARFTVSDTEAVYQVTGLEPLEEGNNSIEVSIADTESNSTTLTLNFEIATLQALPGVSAARGKVPLTVTFLTRALDTAGAAELYEWDFDYKDNDGDGVPDFDVDDSNVLGINVTHTYTAAGTYTAALRVTDNRDRQDIGTIEVIVDLNSPTATATVTPTNGPVPLVVNFNGFGTDVDGTITLYEWDFDGDGTFDYSSASSPFTQHTYNDAGTFNAVFRVTDNDGLTGTARVSTTAVRVGPTGSPTATQFTFGTTGPAPLIVSFGGSGFDADGTIVKYEWDFEGDGTFDYESDSTPSTTHTYTVPGIYDARFRVTDDSGLTGVDIVVVTVQQTVTLTVSDKTINPSAGETTTIDTTIAGDALVTIKINDQFGNLVRTLVDNFQRTGGSYSDTWNGKDNNGNVLPDGVYYAVMDWSSAGGVSGSVDSTYTTGGFRTNPVRNSMRDFSPFDNDFLPITYTLDQPAFVDLFVGLFNVDERFITLLNFDPQGAGEHTVFWDGLDAEGRIATPPPDDFFLIGIFSTSMADNAMVLEGTRPEISNVSSNPNFFDPSTPLYITPASPVARVNFDLSESASITMLVANTETNTVVRGITTATIAGGEHRSISWDGKDDQGIFVVNGTYRLGLTATDPDGNRSVTMFALVVVNY